LKRAGVIRPCVVCDRDTDHLEHIEGIDYALCSKHAVEEK
jgi:hypothetical protein